MTTPSWQERLEKEDADALAEEISEMLDELPECPCDSLAPPMLTMSVSFVNAEEYERVVAQRDALLAACREMHRSLTSPTRILLDSTRQEMAPWLPMLNEVLAACEEQP